ncbi:TIP41-like protein [Porphyridium purpureum]|uniref:TIP41-like protein n=1 Tax=Porphyridium purpureum TaxID=35688 RepID=A0A5J4Z9N1_PORPP|nr:TIP41-like protein [Porphyridium purpureum]|eukprot:POR6008..scf295_1
MSGKKANGVSMVEHAGWRVSAVSQAMMSSEENDALLEARICGDAFTLPGVVFPHNVLRIEQLADPDGGEEQGMKCVLEFSVRAALQGVGPADPKLSVLASDSWKQKSARPDVQHLDTTADWTFSTNYHGSLTGAELIGRSAGPASPTEDPDQPERPRLQTIDLERCRQTNLPIRFYAEVILFEDELDDHGAVLCSVRVRVMDSFFLVLFRYFLRIDHVLVRFRETRYYHVFGERVIVQENQERESPLDALQFKIPGNSFGDPDRLQPHVKLLRSELINWKLSM